MEECVFRWAGCLKRVHRKDLPQHVNVDMSNHMMLLAVSCGQLKEENDILRKDNDMLEKRYEELQERLDQVIENLFERNSLDDNSLDEFKVPY